MTLSSDYPPSYRTNDFSPRSYNQPNAWSTSLHQESGNIEQQNTDTFRSRDEPVPSHNAKSCRFLQGVEDECYKNRFYARALDFYLLEENFPQNQTYHCPMAKCTQDSFKSPQSMLRHLKTCDCFINGEFHCPTCNKPGSFQTVSKRRCSWDKILRAVKSPVNTFKDTIRRSSAPNAHTPGLDVSHGWRSEAHSRLDLPELDSPHFFEADSLPVIPFPELESTEFIRELDSKAITTPHNSSSPTSSHQVSSVSQSSEGGYSNNVSPTSETMSSNSASSNESKSQILTYLDVDGTNGDFPVDDVGDSYKTLIGSWNTQLYPMEPISNVNNILDGASAMLSTSLVGQLGYNERGLPLSIDTENLDPTLTTPIWERQSFQYDSGTWAFVNSTNAPPTMDFEPQSQSLENMTLFYGSKDFPMATLPNETLSNTQDATGFEFSFGSKLEYPAPTHHESPCSESSDSQLKCRHCEFVPTGKRENLRSYLRKHENTHKSRSPHTCPLCTVSFTRRDNLTAHIRHYHPERQDLLSSIPPKRRRSSCSLDTPLSKRRKSSTS
ncbi:hypothetical protein F5X99DRAFT_347943 [Biscogniauxia marginata]|nr:hypothetical protein F5X99DRAFT_347943 [Biscogniauxia marginata]